MTINLHNWESQLHKGALELMVLVCVQDKEAYGGQILQQMNKAEINITEGTLYPLLNRMQRNGWLESRWETPESSGHPRRYYAISLMAKKLLPDMIDRFYRLSTALRKIQKND